MSHRQGLLPALGIMRGPAVLLHVLVPFCAVVPQGRNLALEQLVDVDCQLAI